MNRAAARRLRQRLNALREERERLEESLLSCGALIRGRLQERYLGSGASRRYSPAYYLAYGVPGRKTRHQYLRPEEVPRIRPLEETYRRFQKALTRLRALQREMFELWPELRQQLEMPRPESPR